MKTLNKYILVVTSALLLNGCVDMDTFPEGDILTSDQKEEVIANDPSKAEAGVTGIFAQFSTYMSAIPASSRHNDIGYPAIMLFTESNGHDYLSADNGYNWTGNSLDFSDRNFAGNEAKIVWNTLYQMIYVTNTVIGSIDPETEDPTAQFFLGQALAARAFDYWVLAQLYQFNYADHKSAPCVPLVTEKNALTVPIEGIKRSTVEEVYTQITSDINRAIEFLANAQEAGKKRRDKRYIDLGVAYGLRARVNLTMEKWEEAANDAKQAISLSGATPYSMKDVSVPTMSDSNDASWLWGIIVAETDRVVTSGIVNWPSHNGSLSYGYANYSGSHQINKKLWNSIPESDVRKGWWLDTNASSKNLNEDYQAFVKENEYAPYTHVKFAPYKNEAGTSTNANDIPLMRVEEMYLIQAEAEAMSGNGKTTLEDFVKTYRDPEYVCTAASPADIQEEVLRQRRIELWGEGFAWFDIMRLKKPIDRRGAGYPDATMVFNIPANSDIMLWRIPDIEINANKLLNPEDNNPSAPFPTPVADIN